MKKIFLGLFWFLPTRRYVLRLLKKYKDKVIIILPQTSKGDTIIALSFANVLEKSYLIVGCEANKDIIENYNLDAAVLIKKNKSLKRFVYFSGVIRHLSSGKIIKAMRNQRLIIGHQSAYIITKKQMFLKELSAIGIIRDLGYSLPSSANPHFFSLKSYHNPNITDWFIENKRPIVLLNNDSDSSPSINEEIFDDLIKMLINKGYIVFLSKYPDPSKPIVWDNNPIFFYSSWKDLVITSKYFNYIISVRSGILDVIAGCNKHIIAIHTKKEWESLYRMEMWNNGAVDISYDSETLVKDIEKVISGDAT